VWLKGRGVCRNWPADKKIDTEHCIFPVGVEALGTNKLSVFNQVKMGAAVAEMRPICGQLEGVLPIRPKAPANGERVYFENEHWAEHLLVHESDTCPWGHL
jgi:hypothetical protein